MFYIDCKIAALCFNLVVFKVRNKVTMVVVIPVQVGLKIVSLLNSQDSGERANVQKRKS